MYDLLWRTENQHTPCDTSWLIDFSWVNFPFTTPAHTLFDVFYVVINDVTNTVHGMWHMNERVLVKLGSCNFVMRLRNFEFSNSNGLHTLFDIVHVSTLYWKAPSMIMPGIYVTGMTCFINKFGHLFKLLYHQTYFTTWKYQGE